MTGEAIRPVGAGPRETAAAIAAASCGLVLAALPVFLVGGLAVQIRADLAFTETALGALVSGALLVGAATAPLGGRIADRLGARAAIAVGASLSLVALGGIAGGARSWTHMAAFLAVAGLGLAITDPGLAILLIRGAPARRQGLAFGVKEASIPIATLAAGLAVPAIALTAGWRWAFLLGLVPVAGLVVLLPRLDLDRPRPRGAATTAPPPAGPRRRSLLLLAVAAGLGMIAASGVGVFLTQSAVAMGLSPAAAGFLLAAGSGAGIVARIAVGFVADHRGGPQLGVVAGMLGVGAVAMTLGIAGTGPLLVAATIGAFAAGWGWSGLLFLSVVRASPGAPGAAAGIAVAGLAAGNGLGPLLFGVVAERASYGTAWAAAAAIAALAALLMRAAQPGIERVRAGGDQRP